MPQATLQVRQTTTTTTSRASVLVINTGYLTSKLGILKLILLILSLICFILLLLEANHPHRAYSGYYYDSYGYPSSDMFLILVTFGNWFTITLMLIAALLSLGTASLLTKTSYDFMFHFVACVLYLIGGLWVAIGAFGDYERTTKIQVAAILALICGVLHLVHGVFSYRSCITNWIDDENNLKTNLTLQRCSSTAKVLKFLLSFVTQIRCHFRCL